MTTPQHSSWPHTWTDANLARLGHSHGFRAELDFVHLHAMFNVTDPAAHQRSWALQLWASDRQPFSAEDTGNDLLLAEAPLPPIGELADETERFEVSAFLTPPAGTQPRTVALALASGSRGHFHEIHDFALYPLPQAFINLRLHGNIAYSIAGDRVFISVERIENPRDAANVSGSLSLELWALPHSYDGGAFQGVPLAAGSLGQLPGQTEWLNTALDLNFAQPPEGAWRFVLMLREWTAAGYLTRDFSEFANTVCFGPAREPSAEKATELPTADISVPDTKAAKTKATAVDKKASAAQAEAVPSPSKTSPVSRSPRRSGATKKTTSSAAAPTQAEPAGTPAQKKEKKTAKTAEKAPATDDQAKPSRVSVNHAKPAELAEVKGLPPKVADAIVKGRPYASVDDLLKVKGIGEKLLEKVRKFLKL